MSGYRVIGIDPGLAHVGLCVLSSLRPHAYVVSDHEQIETSPDEPLFSRLQRLFERVERFLLHGAPFDAIVVESPVGRSGRRGRSARAKGQYKSPHDISVQGLATGVELAAALKFPGPVAFIDADEWMPKTKSGNFEHTIRREQLVAWLRSEVTMPPSTMAKKYEHVVMAAGVARYWIVQQRTDRLIAQTGDASV